MGDYRRYCAVMCAFLMRSGFGIEDETTDDMRDELDAFDWRMNDDDQSVSASDQWHILAALFGDQYHELTWHAPACVFSGLE